MVKDSPQFSKDNARQVAFYALKSIYKGAFADVALDQVLHQSKLNKLDRGLVTELVYGTIRRMRTLDVIIEQLATKKPDKQPPDLRTILHLGLYQLRYLDQIPESAAVNTTVDLAKHNGFSGLSGFVNGILRSYIRLNHQIKLPENPASKLGILHSFPDWIIQDWLAQFGTEETEKLCLWMNQTPTIDLRVNILKTSLEDLENTLQEQGINVTRIADLHQGLRLTKNVGAIDKIPGFTEGLFTIQDSSAQMVAHLLDPQPHETIIDACAAPGGKTTHIVELIGDQGTVFACDRTASRLKKLQQNTERLEIKSIKIKIEDSRNIPQFTNMGDRVLLDVPCSGLGTLHRHADARWKQTPEKVQELAKMQTEILNHAQTWVKENGFLVYATCTLNTQENEQIITKFLAEHPQWKIVDIPENSPFFKFTTEKGWLKILPHQYDMDGFFMVKMQKSAL
jgi:16S rRNA (cytosine967-C5)-methyltransferase